jgi:hypothetical protein
MLALATLAGAGAVPSHLSAQAVDAGKLFACDSACRMTVATLDPTALQATDSAAATASVACGSDCLQAMVQAAAGVSSDCDSNCSDKRPGMAALQVVLLNYLVGTFNRFARNEPFTYVGPQTWWTNIKEGFNWDDNNFSTNQLAHPYHGSMYYSAGRSNHLDFWESVPLTAAGSLMWEFLGEAHRPAFNDWLSTTMGGIALGESTYRLSTMVFDNELRGGKRIWHEIAGTLINPMHGFNRLMTGEMAAHGPNEREHDPGFLGIRIDLGASSVGQSGSLNDATTRGFSSFDFQYGDPWRKAFSKPFDFFRMSVQLNAKNKKVLGRLQVDGILYADQLRDDSKWLFAVGQNYDYINNDALEFGRHAVSVGALSRFPISDGLELRGAANANLIILGGINSEFVGINDRTYDYGPGAGLGITLRLVQPGSLFRYGFLGYRLEYIYTVSGADSDHVAQVISAGAAVPVWRTLGIGIDGTIAQRDSHFRDFPDVSQRNPQVRAYLTWWLY